MSTDSPITSAEDAGYVEGWVREAFEYMAMTDYPYPSSFLEPMPGWPVKVGNIVSLRLELYRPFRKRANSSARLHLTRRTMSEWPLGWLTRHSSTTERTRRTASLKPVVTREPVALMEAKFAILKRTFMLVQSSLEPHL